MILQENFDKLIESIIESYNWDILNNKLSMSLIQLENGLTSKHQLEFRNVSCLYFSNNTSQKRTIIVPTEDDDYLELTSIHLLAEKTSISLNSDEDTWIHQFDGGGNVVLELWNKLLVIECSQVIIDNQIYHL